MTVKLAYITTARSDYGPAYWLIHDLFHDARFDVALIVGGSHLSERHGHSVSEIENDGWPIFARVPFLEAADNNAAHAGAVGQALTRFARLFDELKPDVAVVYGDRYELLAVAAAAVVTRTPLAHSLWRRRDGGCHRRPGSPCFDENVSLAFSQHGPIG